MQAKSIYSTVLDARLIVELALSLENMENKNPNIYWPADLWLTRGQAFFSRWASDVKWDTDGSADGIYSRREKN